MISKKNVRFNITLKKEIKEKLENFILKNKNYSVSKIIEMLLENYLNFKEKQEEKKLSITQEKKLSSTQEEDNIDIEKLLKDIEGL